ncbi:MAG TPA: MerR family transcriptional regulator [Rhizobiaceae bacterium]|nr:MerR family transcriptional regulator [Rhizobiaceae bacterium]
MEKSEDAFRTISEVAELLDLPQHVLRFWETRFAQIKPMKRGGGRRYYRPADVDLLKGIRHLLYDQGFTIKGVQKLLRENGVQFAVALGNGDRALLEEITKRQSQSAEAEQAAEADPDGDILVGASEPRLRRLLGLGRGATTEGGEAGSLLSKDNRALLQEALFDLLECKRLLDQTR